jgi:Na+-translocating ferredoxin:NAD+ oxidoreductase RnfG subunit
MKKYKDSIKTVAVLAVIALVSGLLLAYVNSITQIDEDQAALLKVDEAYQNGDVSISIDLTPYSFTEDGEVLYAFSMTDGAYAFISHSNKAFKGSGLEMLVFIKDDKIVQLENYRNEETPGVGDKAFATNHLAQYIGLDVTKVSQVRLNSDIAEESVKNIDGITGSTKTSVGVNIAVNEAIHLYRQIQGLA